MSAQVGAKPKGSSGPMNITDITGVANSHIAGADAAAKGGAAFQRCVARGEWRLIARANFVERG